jgi:hypothetical protein
VKYLEELEAAREHMRNTEEIKQTNFMAGSMRHSVRFDYLALDF